MKKRINISIEHRKKLQEEFDVTKQSVYFALRYVTNSELANAIRRRAKQLLIEEAKKI